MLNEPLPNPIQRAEALGSLSRYGAACMRPCQWCGAVQDALSAKQRAEPQGITWRCCLCRHFNSWKVKKR